MRFLEDLWRGNTSPGDTRYNAKSEYSRVYNTIERCEEHMRKVLSSEQVDRRGGAIYIISPFKLIINDGYYYVLAWNSSRNHTVTYRLDRMKGVEVLNEAREGNLEFSKINMESYTQQHFGMFSGEQKTVSLRFANRLLDTMVDRFGTGADVFYRPDGDEHFVVTTQIAISDQFYGWVSGFRKMAQIMSPPDVVADFQTFLDDIYGQYES